MFKSLESKVTPFGGLHLIHKQLRSKKFSQFIDEELGNRSKPIGYNYSDIILTRIYTTLCGGTATEDVNYIRENTLDQLKHFDAPSPDTILRGDCELATPCEFVETDSGKENKINVNERLNNFLISCANFLGVLPKKDLIYDFDNQFIATEKYDATYSYKKEKGYFPGVVSISGLPLYIEGRNGNCNVKTAQLATHERAIEDLHNHGIYPKYVRMDAGSYIKEVVNFFHSLNTIFFIRANSSHCLLREASSVPEENWKDYCIGFQDIQATTLTYRFGEEAHRIVAYRVPNKTGQLNVFTGDACTYRFLITNDWKKSDKQVIEFYNQRGTSEKVFDVQNNDFNWKCMPHSFLNENTVYLILMAIARIVYEYLMQIFDGLIENLGKRARLKQFIFRFVSMVAKVTQSGRREVIALATTNQKLIHFMNSA